MQSNAPSTTARAAGPSFSNAQPQQNLVVLSVVSFGLYPAYWLYRNLKALKAHRNLSINPAWRTFVAFVPLIGWPVFKDQMQLFLETAAADGVATAVSPWGCTLGFQLVSMTTWVLPLPWFVFGNAAVIFLLPVQRALNAYWAVEQPDVPARQGYSAGEAVLIVACSLVWLLIVAVSFIGDRIVVLN